MLRRKKSKEAAPRGNATRSKLVWRVLCCVAAYLVVAGVMGNDLRSRRVTLEAGDVATETIKATREVVDEITTERRRQDAAAAVQNITVADESISQSVVLGIDQCYEIIVDTRAMQQSEYISWENRKLLMDPEVQIEDYAYSESLLTHAREQLPVLGEDDILAMLGANSVQLERLFAQISELAAATMEAEIREAALEQNIGGIEEVLAQGDYPEEMQALAHSVLAGYMRPNSVISEEQTQTARQMARDRVEPVVYKAGQNIVREGETITEEQLAMLESLAILNHSTAFVSMRVVGMAVITAVLLAIMWVYIALFEKETFDSLRLVILINVALVITMLVCWLTKQWEIYMLPAAMAALFIAVLVNHRIAVVCNFLVAAMVGIIAVIDQNGSFAGYALPVALAALASGCTAVYVAYRNPQRTTILFAGFCAGLVNMVVYASVDLISATGWEEMARNAAMGVMGGMLASVICLGTLPVWEWIFQVVTPMKLMEISNPNHPLLKKLLVEAPGTYNHSIIVGNLAESAAQAIGANALLTRTGAYYHDVGKIKRPVFFKENQTGENPHDNIDPSLSARIIRAHPVDGYEMGKAYKIPTPILNIIREHHGDGLISYFYHKAKEQAKEGETVDEAEYRYPCPLPQTRESALIMLADTVEAAVRSMKEHTSDKMDAMIRRLIDNILDAGLLRHCDLTLNEIDIISVTFRNVLSSVYHERIEYPNQNV